MRTVPINEAEAIVEPFWDGGSSEHPKDKYSRLNEYVVELADGVIGEALQLWYCVEVNIDSAPAGCNAITIKRQCDISIEGYDIFRVFAALPDKVCMTVRGCIDGENVTLIENYTGINDTDEIDGAISGKRMQSIELSFGVTAEKRCSIILMWLGLSNRKMQEQMEAAKSPYTPDWTGHLGKKTGSAAPQLGIYFNNEELADIRSRVKQGILKNVYEKIKEQAVKDLNIIPEDCIGTFVPDPNEFCRRRDMKYKVLAEPMERLAFVGIIDENVEMSRMAARMALSISHCTYWCESIMGAFPGATWHHRSFTEEMYTRACALVLDWAGYCMTPHGRQVVTDAMIMKGLPRIESDFKRMEYIRNMNQGIAFCTGRIIGLVALVKHFPRYHGLLLEAENDMFEMLDNYIHSDGGTLEGVNYWDYTFFTAVRALYALSRYHNIPFEKYLPPKLVKTGDYPLGMLSTAGEGTTLLPVVDAHINERIRTSLAAAFFSITRKNEWKILYNKRAAEDQNNCDIYHLIFFTDRLEEKAVAMENLIGSRVTIMKDIGYVNTVRCTEEMGNILFFYNSGPIEPGHFHEDKGSFIIEASGEVLAMDRGITNYANPETKFLTKAEYHNLLYPENKAGKFWKRPSDMPGGKIGSAIFESGLLLVASSQQNAWEKGVFDVNTRRIISPLPDLFIIDDEIEMSEAREMSFIINSLYPMESAGDNSFVTATRTKLRVIPLNWMPEMIITGIDSVDGDLNPVNRLRLRTGRSKNHRLLTAIEVLPVNQASVSEYRFTNDGEIFITKSKMEILVNGKFNQKLIVKIFEKGKETLEAGCTGTDWRFPKDIF